MMDEYKERGLIQIDVIIEDSTAGADRDGTVNWKEARSWARGDYNGDGTLGNTPEETQAVPPRWPLKLIVLADTDRGLWNRYIQKCNPPNDILCNLTCPVTPQNQIFDPGLVTVDDTCRNNNGSGSCTGCGFDEAHTRSVLNTILPPLWCGEGNP